MIVTAIDRGFLEGMIALRNSVRCHSPDVPFACMTYGDPELAEEVESYGVRVVHNLPVGPCPPGEGTPFGNQPMYARWIAPEIFGDCIWMDADQVLCTDISSLLNLKFSHPFAAPPANYTTQRDVIENGVMGSKSIKIADSFFSGLMVFNSRRWRELDLYRRCVKRAEEASLDPERGLYYRFVVQSIIACEVVGDFHRIDQRWSTPINRDRQVYHNPYVLHWLGRSIKPWETNEEWTSQWWKYRRMYSLPEAQDSSAAMS